MSFRYFAYGSNLLRERLVARCPGVSANERASVPGKRLTFGKLSLLDRSGKGTFENAEGSLLPGVLWSLPEEDLTLLDRIEGVGHGYQRIKVEVDLDSGQQCDAVTYLGTDCDPTLLPFDWYLALVIAGAVQQMLPESHIRLLRESPFQIDPDLGRTARIDAIAVLEQAGMTKILNELTAANGI